MRKSEYLILFSTLSILAFTGLFLTAYGSPSTKDEYAVGGEIIPVNPSPFLLSPALLAAVTIILVLIVASMFLKDFPVKITIETQ
ncbi:hypothetical protein KEJ49_02635 [Candidatus Bathyarchaeota archaeon]|nr:hypothetical protein [Candidatus Bathyarchaeota archaeon]